MLRIRIEQVQDPINPRTDFDHAGTMVCWHRRYDLGDEQPKLGPDDWAKDFANDLLRAKGRKAPPWYGGDTEREMEVDDQNRVMAHVWAIIRKHAVILPLYLYDHSGLSISTNSFGDPWDSGHVGYIYMTRATVVKEYGGFGEDEQARARKTLQYEVEEYDQYLTGDVWGVIIEESDPVEEDEDAWTEVDSCWGFYGYGYAEKEAVMMLQAAEQQRQKALDALAHIA